MNYFMILAGCFLFVMNILLAIDCRRDREILPAAMYLLMASGVLTILLRAA